MRSDERDRASVLAPAGFEGVVGAEVGLGNLKVARRRWPLLRMGARPTRD